MNNKTLGMQIKTLLVGVVIGSALTFPAYYFLTLSNSNHDSSALSVEKKPLYWVAPMDANYRRDQPGKSPMGMDLVPVYDDDGKGPDEGVGTIRISSEVVNNLGVRTVEASYRLLQTEINTVGYVAYNEDKLVHIHPRVQGWIEKLYVKSVGEPIKKHQALYDIYSPELVNAQEELILAIDRKNSRLISAAESRLVALQLSKAAIAKLKKTKQVQQTITFYSPQNGVVETLSIREGFFVQPSSTLLSIGDLSEVWVEAEVFERQAGQVKTGMAVTMSLDYLPGKLWQGKVDYIYPTLDANTRTVKVRVRFNNEDGEFKPNMFAQITIHPTQDERALLIPKEALIRTGSQNRVVLALGQGSFKSIVVKVGRFDRESVEILEGLSDGERVVSSAQFLLDSESSKSSDFKRMAHEDINTMGEMDMTQSNEGNSSSVSGPPTAKVIGTIKALMIDHGMITISRSAIEKWNRPAATVDFIAAKGVSLNGLSVDMAVEFTFEIRDNNFVIVEIAKFTANEPPARTSLSEVSAVDHSNH